MNDLLVGVEEEQFIIENDPSRKGFAQRSFLKKFSSDYSYRIVCIDPQNGMPLQINKDFENGYISIKFDSTINTLEVAYPPFRNILGACDFIEDLNRKLNEAASSTGLKLFREGYRNIPVNKESFFSKESVQQTILRPNSLKPLFDQFYPAKICATQVHLNLNNADAFNKLDKYYLFEPLVPLLFSNSIIQGKGHCYRLLVLQDAFLESYRLFGFPLEVPNTDEKYKSIQKSIKGFWRDYSLITPREHKTWEFRSACVQSSFFQLRNLLEFRIGVAKVINDFDLSDVKFNHARQAYTQVCLDPNHSIVSDYLSFLERSKLLERLLTVAPFLEASLSNYALKLRVYA